MVDKTDWIDERTPASVVFHHPFFTAVSEIRFVLSENTGEPVLRMPLGDADVELSFHGLIGELNLTEGSEDFYVLQAIEKSLNYVQGMCIGDPVPSEVYSGEASWEVSEQHKARARHRISIRLVCWLTGEESLDADSHGPDGLIESPQFISQVREAYKKIADQLDEDSVRGDDVVDMVHRLSEELAYIEALLDQLAEISLVESRLKELAKIYNRNHKIDDDVQQCNRLCAVPMEQYRTGFGDVFVQIGDIASTFANLTDRIAYIRDFRDDTRPRFRAWLLLAKKWSGCPAERSAGCAAMINETYHFLAQRFLPQKEWELYTKIAEKTEENVMGDVW